MRLEATWGVLVPFGVGSANPTTQVSMALYDRLVGISPDGKKIVPYLASDWKVDNSSTRSSVTFTIRKDVTCSDGTLLTPSAIANYFKVRTAANPTGRGYKDVATFIGVGPYEFTGNDAAGTLAVTGPANNELLNNFAWPQMSVICPAGLAAKADFNTKSYGSGPYVFESSTANSLVVRRRPEWIWGPNNTKATDPGVPDTITFVVVENTTTAANLLTTKDLDLSAIRGADLPRLRDDKSLAESKAAATQSQTMYMNHDPSRPTSDPVVRKALSMAVDPKAWIVATYAGEAVVSTSIVSSDVPCYDPQTANLVQKPAGDTAAARGVLTAAGWTAGADGKLQKGGKPLTIEVLGDPLHASGPEYVVEQFNKMGATAKLVPIPDGSRSTRIPNGQFDIHFETSGGRLPVIDPGPSHFTGKGTLTGQNVSRVDDPTLEKLLLDARSQNGCDGWFQFQRRLLTEYHMLPLANATFSAFARNMAPVLVLGNYLDVTSFRRVR